MASNDFSPASSSDSEVSEIEDYELEVEDSPNSSDQARDVEETQEAYADEPLADAEWLMSGYYVRNYTRPIPFWRILRLGNGFSNLDFS